VIDDPHRLGPKEGTRGTEGGVSEKSKNNQFASDKVPGAPKEAPPLPHSEQIKIPPADDVADSKDIKGEDSGEKILEVRTIEPSILLFVSNSIRIYRNQQTFPKNLMISPLPNLLRL
jgi:hypothetical protein